MGKTDVNISCHLLLA